MSHGELRAPEGRENPENLFGGKFYQFHWSLPQPESNPELDDKNQREGASGQPSGRLEDSNTNTKVGDRQVPVNEVRINPSNAIRLAHKYEPRLLESLEEPTEPGGLGKRQPLEPILDRSDAFSKPNHDLKLSLRDMYDHYFKRCPKAAQAVISHTSACLPKEFGLDSIFTTDLRYMVALHKRLFRLHSTKQPVVTLPVKFKVMNMQMVKPHSQREVGITERLQTEQIAENPAGQPSENKQLTEVKKLLAEHGVISQSGDLRLSHSCVFESFCCALAEDSNIRKVGQLGILMPQGLYLHTFEVSAHESATIKAFFQQLRNVIDSYDPTQQVAQPKLKLGARIHPLGRTLKQKISEAICRVRRSTNDRPDWIKQYEEEMLQEKAKRKKSLTNISQMTASEFCELVAKHELLADLTELYKEWEDPKIPIGREKYQNLLSMSVKVDYDSEHNKELGKILGFALVQHYRKEFVQLDAPANALQKNAPVDPLESIGAFGDCKVDLTVNHEYLIPEASLPSNIKVSYLPVEFKAKSFELLREFDYRKSVASGQKSSAETPPSIQLEATLEDFLIRDKLISPCGRLMPSHTSVLQSIIYAIIQKNNEDKVGQLVVLTPYGLYIHTFQVPAAVERKVKEIIATVRDKEMSITTSNRKEKPKPQISSESFASQLNTILAQPSALADLSKVLLPHLVKALEEKLLAGDLKLFGFCISRDDKS